jgi:hypothetical protein
MTAETLNRWGWITLDAEPTKDDRWSALAMRDKEVIIAIADTREEALDAAWSMMERLTLEASGDIKP